MQVQPLRRYYLYTDVPAFVRDISYSHATKITAPDRQAAVV